MMKLFSRYTVKTALRALLFMFTCVLLSLFLGSGSLSDNDWIGWGLFTGFVIIYIVIAFYDGSDRGARDSQISARNERLIEKGHQVEQDALDRSYDRRKGLVMAALIAAPGLLLTILSLITMDQVIVLRAIVRLYFAPFLKLFRADAQPLVCVASYFLFALIYPILYYIGYLIGPKQYKKQTDLIRQNEEDYKNGIRRRRKAHKRRRGLFW